MEIKGKYANSSLALKQGIIVDLVKMQFTKFTKLFNLFRFKEKSKPLPKVEYILLFKTIYTKCQPHTTKEFDESAIVQLSLVYDKTKKLIINESTNLGEQKKLAARLAEELHVGIRDSATDRRNPIWLN